MTSYKATSIDRALSGLASSIVEGGSGGASVQVPAGLAEGGFANGAGSGTSDSNLALLSDGEFVA